jgi:hypothetical protein
VVIGENVFDVLIDSETVRADKGADLKKILGEYGAIIIKIVDGQISKKEFISFLQRYQIMPSNGVGR